MLTHSSLIDRSPCSLSHSFVIPVWVGSVRAQGRFRAITDAQIEDIQNQLNAKWDHYSQIPESDV
ncbi:MAG TPA: hypothetical protein PK874_13925 [Desulfobacteraceae bacterium]|nr:hypothetical protein [Desulfobacteraceae bacterium]HPJ67231.1 hypothetical protein [Desulfobacteraceae bacterium]HPQ27389.1 hypothetical protein [Desulfobacteraceae bacterium]